MTTSVVRSTKRGRGLSLPTSIAAALSAWIFGGVPAAHAVDPPFPYVRAKAFHIPPETTTEESGYFSLCEGRNGKIYIGTAAYGRDSYLVEFNPATERMRVVMDTHKLVGLPLTPTGYAAQAKIHTRNFVGPSGKIYVGSKQGYPAAAEREALKRGKKIPVYRGGYVMVYDPATGTAENLGMPMPLDDKQIAAGKKEGQGVIDVTADESRGLIYVITCEEQHWMLYDTRTRTYRELGPILRDQPNTLIDAQGRGTAITVDYRVARYDPATDKVTVDPLLVEGKPFAEFLGAERVHPDWRITPDGKTAYLQLLDDLRMFRVDLSGPVGRPVTAWNLGDRVRGKHPDSRGSIGIGPDGRVYSSVRVDNETGFGSGYLHHLVRHDPATRGMDDLGVFAVNNPGFFDFASGPGKNPDGSSRPVPRLPHAAGWHPDAAARHHGPDRRPRWDDLRHDDLSLHPVEGRIGQGIRAGLVNPAS